MDSLERTHELICRLVHDQYNVLSDQIETIDSLSTGKDIDYETNWYTQTLLLTISKLYNDLNPDKGRFEFDKYGLNYTPKEISVRALNNAYEHFVNNKDTVDNFDISHIMSGSTIFNLIKNDTSDYNRDKLDAHYDMMIYELYLYILNLSKKHIVDMPYTFNYTQAIVLTMVFHIWSNRNILDFNKSNYDLSVVIKVSTYLCELNGLTEDISSENINIDDVVKWSITKPVEVGAHLCAGYLLHSVSS